MATIIDEFITLFTIDPKGVEQGGARVRDETRKTKDAAQSAGRDVQDTSKRSAEMVSTIRREVVSLGLAVAGASGIKAFLGGIIANDAAVGRTATNLGVAVEALSAWQGAVKAAGGTAADADSAFRGLQQAQFALRTTGQSGIGPELQYMGIGENSLLEGPEATLRKLAGAADRMDRTAFVGMAQKIGLPESVINTLARGTRGLEEQLAEQRRLGTATKESADAAIEFERTLANLQTRLVEIGREPLTDFLGKLDGFITQAGGVEKASNLIVAAVAAIGGAAVLANLPLIAMITSLTALIRLAQLWENRTPAKREEKWKESKDFMTALKRNDFEGAWEIFKSGMHDTLREVGLEQGGGGTPATATPGGGGGDAAYFRRNGWSDAAAQGIAAGIHAESGGRTDAKNPTSGAAGIGQWLGSRKRQFVAKYGVTPDKASREQQLEFMLWELRNTEKKRAGMDLYRAKTADDALGIYINQFMRPAKGAETAGDMRRGRAFLQSGGTARLAQPAGGRGASNDNRVSTSTTQATIIIQEARTPEETAVRLQQEVRRRGLAGNAPNGPQ